MYQNIDNNLKKTAIQATPIHLNTADGSPMTALGITTLQFQIADFSSHSISSYVIGYQILRYYLALMYRRNSHYPMLGTKKGTATYRRKVDFLPTLETVNRRQMSLL